MTFTTEARQHLENYLAQMRTSLGEGDADDVEQDIRDHIEAELAERPSPVSADDLDAVLARLGDPQEWLLAADAPAVTVPHGTRMDDWLAYAAIALLLAGFVLPFFIPVSWLAARWALARLEQRGEDAGTSRWLLYPPLAFVSIALVLLALFWPFGMFGELGAMLSKQRAAIAAVAIGGLGVYWAIAGALAAIDERVVRFLFHPFARSFRRRHAWWLSAAGVVVAIAAAAVFVAVR